MFKYLAVAAVISAIPNISAAQEGSDPGLSRCLEIQNDRQRLACFDAELGYEAVAPIVASEFPWTFIEDVDPMTDAETSYVILRADVPGGQNDAPRNLVIRCLREGGSEVFVTTQGYIGDTRNRVSVAYRWNGAAATSEDWSSSTAGTGAFLPTGYRDFLAGLNEGGPLVFEWRDFRGNRTASSWSDVQLDDNARYVLDGCQSSS